MESREKSKAAGETPIPVNRCPLGFLLLLFFFSSYLLFGWPLLAIAIGREGERETGLILPAGLSWRLGRAMNFECRDFDDVLLARSVLDGEEKKKQIYICIYKHSLGNWLRFNDSSLVFDFFFI